MFFFFLKKLGIFGEKKKMVTYCTALKRDPL